jgi:excisionase family DNA binding protein
MYAIGLHMKAIDQNNQGSIPQPWINALSAAEYLSVSIVTLRRWVKQGRLKPKRTPGGELRFRISDLDALITQ